MARRSQGSRLRFVPALLVFISGYFPLAIILVIKDTSTCCFGPYFQHPAVAWSVILVTLIAVTVVLLAPTTFKHGSPVTISKMTYKSGDMFTYTVPYMIAFYKFDLGDWNMILCFAVFMILMFSLAYRTQNLLINPVLALAGYHLWDCQFTEGKNEFSALLLSKHEFQKGDECVVERITHFLYFVVSVTTNDDPQ